MQYSGKIVTTADYGATYSIPDTDGTLFNIDYFCEFFFFFVIYLGQYPSNIRSLSFLFRQVPALSWLSSWIPGFLKLPYWLLHQASNKF
jgi:hypothetical protein